MVRRFLSSLDEEAQFTVGSVGNSLRDAGVKLENIAVSRVLLKLHKTGELDLVVEGSGRVPHVYRKSATFRPLK